MMNTGMAGKEGPPSIGVIFEDLEKRVAALRQELANLETALQPCLRAAPKETEGPQKATPSGSMLRCLATNLGSQLNDIQVAMRSLAARVDL